MLKWVFQTSSSSIQPHELLVLSAEKEAYQRMYSEIWNENDMDVIICPVHALPPLPSSSFPYVRLGINVDLRRCELFHGLFVA